MSKLFTEIKIGDLQLENRIAILPMCQYSAGYGLVNDWYLMHYGNLALSDAALLIFESTAINSEGKSTYGDLGLWDDIFTKSMSHVINYIRLHSNTKLTVQLSHAGHKASTVLGWKPDAHMDVKSTKRGQT